MKNLTNEIYLEEQDVNGIIILKWIVKKQFVEVYSDHGGPLLVQWIDSRFP
jgi:hypothetical protein